MNKEGTPLPTVNRGTRREAYTLNPWQAFQTRVIVGVKEFKPNLQNLRQAGLAFGAVFIPPLVAAILDNDALPAVYADNPFIAEYEELNLDTPQQITQGCFTAYWVPDGKPTENTANVRFYPSSIFGLPTWEIEDCKRPIGEEKSYRYNEANWQTAAGVNLSDIIRQANTNSVPPNAKTSATVDCRTDNYYVVKKGDTLSAIAQRYGLTVNQIAKNNSLANPNLINPGQKLCLPISTDKPAPIYNQTTDYPAPSDTPAAVISFPESPTATPILTTPNNQTPVVEPTTVKNKPVDKQTASLWDSLVDYLAKHPSITAVPLLAIAAGWALDRHYGYRIIRAITGIVRYKQTKTSTSNVFTPALLPDASSPLPRPIGIKSFINTDTVPSLQELIYDNSFIPPIPKLHNQHLVRERDGIEVYYGIFRSQDIGQYPIYRKFIYPGRLNVPDRLEQRAWWEKILLETLAKNRSTGHTPVVVHNQLVYTPGQERAIILDTPALPRAEGLKTQNITRLIDKVGCALWMTVHARRTRAIVEKRFGYPMVEADSDLSNLVIQRSKNRHNQDMICLARVDLGDIYLLNGQEICIYYPYNGQKMVEIKDIMGKIPTTAPEVYDPATSIVPGKESVYQITASLFILLKNWQFEEETGHPVPFDCLIDSHYPPFLIEKGNIDLSSPQLTAMLQDITDPNILMLLHDILLKNLSQKPENRQDLIALESSLRQLYSLIAAHTNTDSLFINNGI